MYPNLGLQQSLYEFKVYCMHKSKGCEWTGELGELDNHLNSDPPADKSLEGCPFTLINCPLSCAGCAKGVYRKDVKCHVNDRLFDNLAAQMKSLEQQLQECRDINSQLQQCMTEMETKIIDFSTKNRDLKDEIKEMKLEVRTKASSNDPISNQQPATHVTGTYKPIGAEFTMTHFEEYKRDGDEWYSPHFYTHPRGYKMCLKVYANGHIGAKGTHFSVFACLMRGHFDDQLKWPFRGVVTIKLVDQEEDKDHIVIMARFTRYIPEECCKRVMTEDGRGCGQGCLTVLRLAELQPKFLKNDCIKLCIKKVEIF